MLCHSKPVAQNALTRQRQAPFPRHNKPHSNPWLRPESEKPLPGRGEQSRDVAQQLSPGSRLGPEQGAALGTERGPAGGENTPHPTARPQQPPLALFLKAAEIPQTPYPGDMSHSSSPSARVPHTNSPWGWFVFLSTFILVTCYPDEKKNRVEKQLPSATAAPPSTRPHSPQRAPITCTHLILHLRVFLGPGPRLPFQGGEQ